MGEFRVCFHFTISGRSLSTWQIIPLKKINLNNLKYLKKKKDEIYIYLESVKIFEKIIPSGTTALSSSKSSKIISSSSVPLHTSSRPKNNFQISYTHIFIYFSRLNIIQRSIWDLNWHNLHT